LQNDEKLTYSVSKILPDGFCPSSKDILCGRGKGSYDHIGNCRFRVIIAMNLKSYVESKTKLNKSMIVNTIVENVRESSPATGGFVKNDFITGKWMTLDNSVARSKVGHALRDAIDLKMDLPSILGHLLPSPNR
jgi:hypothetical protein